MQLVIRVLKLLALKTIDQFDTLILKASYSIHKLTALFDSLIMFTFPYRVMDKCLYDCADIGLDILLNMYSYDIIQERDKKLWNVINNEDQSPFDHPSPKNT